MTDFNKNRYKKYEKPTNDFLKRFNNKNKIKPIKEEVNKVNEEIIQFYKEKALEELEDMRGLFIDFQEKISDYAVAEYLVPAIKIFADYAMVLNSVIEYGEINKTLIKALDPSIVKKVQQLKKLRLQVFLSMYNKYIKYESKGSQ